MPTSHKPAINDEAMKPNFDELSGRAERAFEIATNVYQDLHRLRAKYEEEMRAKDDIIYGLQRRTTDLLEENRKLLIENNNLLRDNLKLVRGEGMK
jgi:regulator of replication initiation timing